MGGGGSICKILVKLKILSLLGGVIDKNMRSEKKKRFVNMCYLKLVKLN